MSTVPTITGYYTISEAAEVLSRSESQVSRYIKQGLLPAVAACWDGQKRRVLFLHRFLMEATAAQVCHHRDGNGLNNTMANLEVMLRSQHVSLHHVLAARTKYIGVSRVAPRGRRKGGWRARVRADGRIVSAGQYATEVDAALAHDRKARELFGDQLPVNFPTT